ncbi:conserved hypothetical protein [Lodderomyces elongisporus NRRL YB-4239]|uniref:RRM domain-containing protein n=1 Tax=Lodderomyces elongisporus (strain ATCC 11503 / CBS 2605 / JCM 1781 / NBRC 1676 / NRRL YB-4239) TaxID=379508 RepID=A5DX57_LODEL|nr:conserved hypothetical protein [Lodderomyces elongisporus NRRL YB-4239]
MKDPYRTVFIARLDYSLTELDVTQHFQKYGIIESIKIIRDREGKSRGYGFIVFENEADANTCVNKTSRLGVKLGNRTALVDIERSRILRNWKPRRLGGGEGGRNHVKEGRVASAAATGRRVNIANNPHNQQQLYKTLIELSRGSGGNNLYESGYGYQDGFSSYTSHNSNAQWSSSSHASGYLNPGEHQQSTSVYSSYQPSSASVPHPRAHIPPTTSVFVDGGASSSLPTTSTTVSRSVAATNASPGASVSASIRDKYAKYSSTAGANNQPSTADKYAKYTSIGGGSNNSSSQQSASRSIRSIRRN